MALFGGRSGAALKQSNPAAYYQKYVAPQLDRPGMAGAAANVERQRLLKTLTNQAVNPGLDIRPSPGAAVVAMQDGVPIYGQVQAAPAPSGGGGGGGGGGGNAAAQQLAELTSQSQAYRKEAEAAIEAGKLQISQLQDQELQRQKAAELQNRLAIQAQTSQARGGAQANLKIAPASQTAQTAGTQGFVRRSNQFGITRRSTSTGPVNPYEQVNV